MTPLVASVGFPIAISGIYDYSIGTEFRNAITIGTPVMVTVRSQTLWGIVLELKESSIHPVLKPILDIKEERWADASKSLIELYKWIASYYACDLGKVFKPFVRKTLIAAKAKTEHLYSLQESSTALTKKQQESLDILKTLAMLPATSKAICSATTISTSMIQKLCQIGVLSMTSSEVTREPSELAPDAQDTLGYTLNDEQQSAVDTMAAHLETPSKPFLVHGITGSGKTLVYIELTRLALAMGKGVIILVPEISLTPQTIQRFRGALVDDIAVLHSRMSDGERRDALSDLASGKKRLLIGARSAILAPVVNLGLIIVDEEHDGSYKQGETDPHYHARDVAVMRGKYQHALVVLGSATPSLESYTNATTGKYTCITLSKRFGAARLPSVTVIDMTAEHRENNWTFLSRILKNRITAALENKRQIVLLLNRRGFSISLVCKECAFTQACPHCSVKLVYHRDGTSLRCHQCGYQETAPQRCPKCKGEQFQYRGTGIQKAEEMLAETFPTARILRMDQDTTRRKGAHVSLIDSFAERKFDILLGTQMVAKGLNFPGVALVGVLSADIGLHLPDFRAAEKTFQLLSQVSGRAGRADDLGEVIIQTYCPTDPAVLCAASHDFFGFYNQEIEQRKALDYPPFSRLVRIIVSGTDRDKTQGAIIAMAKLLVPLTQDAFMVLGPSAAQLEKLNNEFRFSILIKSMQPSLLRAALIKLLPFSASLKRPLKAVIDVDPVSML